MILLVILLNVLSVMAFVIYQRRRTEAFQASLKQEIRHLQVIEEGYYFYENFFRIQQILADPAIEVEEAMRRVMKVLTDMGEYQLLQKGAFFLTNPDRESLRMLVQYNADNLLATCQVVYKGQCLCGRVLATGNSINKSCVDHEHEIIPSGMEPHGHYVLPIQWQNDTLGVFTLYVADGAPYSQRTQNFLQMVADAIAKRLMIQRQKAQLQDQLEEIQSGHRAAARLMQAILPTPSLLTALFNGDSAILYAPAQALGGDFYFFHEKGGVYLLRCRRCRRSWRTRGAFGGYAHAGNPRNRRKAALRATGGGAPKSSSEPCPKLPRRRGAPQKWRGLSPVPL